MKTGLIIQDTQSVAQTSCLRGVADILTDSMNYAASRKKSYIINDIPEDIVIDTDENLVASVLSNLLKEIIGHTESGCIRITAKTFNNLVLLHVKNDGSLHYDSMSQNLSAIHEQAEKLGGFVGFTSFRNKVTTIAFSFMNMKEAA